MIQSPSYIKLLASRVYTYSYPYGRSIVIYTIIVLQIDGSWMLNTLTFLTLNWRWTTLDLPGLLILMGSWESMVSPLTFLFFPLTNRPQKWILMSSYHFLPFLTLFLCMESFPLNNIHGVYPLYIQETKH